MGKPVYEVGKYKGYPNRTRLAELIHMDENSIGEHLSLVDTSTPKEVKKAVEKGKLAMRSASMISQLPEDKQI